MIKNEVSQLFPGIISLPYMIDSAMTGENIRLRWIKLSRFVAIGITLFTGRENIQVVSPFNNNNKGRPADPGEGGGIDEIRTSIVNC